MFLNIENNKRQQVKEKECYSEEGRDSERTIPGTQARRHTTQEAIQSICEITNRNETVESKREKKKKKKTDIN